MMIPFPQGVKRYVVALTLLDCILLTMYAAVSFTFFEVNQRSVNLTLESYQILSSQNGITESVMDIFSAARNHVLKADPTAQQVFVEAERSIKERIETLRDLTQDNPEQQTNLQGLDRSLQEFAVLSARQLELKPLGYQESSGEENEAYRQQLVRGSDAVRQALAIFSGSEQARLENRKLQLQQQRQILTFILVLGALGLILTSIGGTFAVYRLVKRYEKSEAALRQSDDRLRMVIEGINDGIYDNDLVNKTVYLSSSYQALLGYPLEKMQQDPDFPILLTHPDDAPHVSQHFERYRRREIPHYVTSFRIRHQDGRWLWLLSRAVGMWDDDGNLVRLIGQHTNISEHKMRETDLQQLNADLENVTHVVSHDLQTPLVNFRGFTGEIRFALEEVKKLVRGDLAQLTAGDHSQLTRLTTQDIPESLDYIDNTINRMDRLVKSILEYSRVGRRHYKVVPVDTKAVIQSCLQIMAYDISQKNVTIEFAEDLPVIIGDPLAIEQVLGNIIDNAIKNLLPHRAGRIAIEAKSLPQGTQFIISDNGRGMDETTQKRVFDLFRPDMSSKSPVRGTGMGMAFAKATMQRLGGRIWFQSTLDVGTNFFVMFPNSTVTGPEASAENRDTRELGVES